MKAEMKDDKTLMITPESTAEMVALQRFEGAKITIDKPEPFAQNIDGLRVEAVETKK